MYLRLWLSHGVSGLGVLSCSCFPVVHFGGVGDSAGVYHVGGFQPLYCHSLFQWTILALLLDAHGLQLWHHSWTSWWQVITSWLLHWQVQLSGFTIREPLVRRLGPPAELDISPQRLHLLLCRWVVVFRFLDFLDA